MRYLSLMLVVCALGCSDSRDTGSFEVSLPSLDCKGAWPEAWVAKEQALMDLANATRAAGGTCFGVAMAPAPTCAADAMLTQISRCFAREQALAGPQALQGADADAALSNRAIAAGYPGQLSGYDGDMVEATPEELMAGFLSTPLQCEAIFNPATNVGGVGYVSYPEGNVPQRWAALMAIKTQ